MWSAKKTNKIILNKAGVNKKLLDTVKAKKLAYSGHIMRKQESCLEKEIMQGTMPGARGEKDHAQPGSTTSTRGQCNKVHLNYVKCIIVYTHITLKLYRLN